MEIRTAKVWNGTTAQVKGNLTDPSLSDDTLHRLAVNAIIATYGPGQWGLMNVYRYAVIDEEAGTSEARVEINLNGHHSR
jgi:hypothetical protein